MTHITLQKLLKARGRLAPVLQMLLDSLGPGIGIQDANGTWLVDGGLASDAPGARIPVLLADQVIGWVCGTGQPEHLESVASLLTYAAGQEAEKRSLATEVLDRYRELNLLHTLSEKLAANPQPAAMAATALDEAARIIPAHAGVVLMLCGDRPCPELMAVIGAAQGLRAVEVAANLVDRVLHSGQAELENDVLHEAVPEGTLSLLCAPLKTESRVLGVLLLVREPPRVFTAGDLVLLNSVAVQAAPALELAHLHQVAVENARLERELQMARQVQASLIPSRMPQLPDWQFAADWRPALEVSGDYYDIIQGADGQWSLVIADVSGKGMPASLFMVFTRSVVRALVDQAYPPAEVLARANHLVAGEAPDGLFVTLFYARLDTNNGDLTYVNAGHNPPLLYRPAPAQMIPLIRTGIALGALWGAEYDQSTIRMEPGDMILFYTDGVTEAFDENREQFGTKRLTQALLEHGGVPLASLLDGIKAEVDRFTGGAPPSDDMTLLAFKRL